MPGREIEVLCTCETNFCLPLAVEGVRAISHELLCYCLSLARKLSHGTDSGLLRGRLDTAIRRAVVLGEELRGCMRGGVRELFLAERSLGLLDSTDKPALRLSYPSAGWAAGSWGSAP